VGQAERASALLAELQARAAGSTWMRWMSELRLAVAATEHWAVRGDHERTLEHAARLSEVAGALRARDYLCAGERIRAGALLARGDDVELATRGLGAALAALRTTPAPLEAWKSARLLAILRRRLGDDDGARAAFAEAARAVGTIAAGTRDETLRNGFLAQPQVREVLESTPGEGPALTG
jgi:hypothetical protein